ncbi:3135_t:CDS:2 [Funneliformis mosseae]|uniref:3135_t:CDS:1 n=1 Tax=Funneliformis mosseae TaxID=27381 RepID=A0A9N9ASW2_FUNMO|nr:3135_t:CDS:2 [Funneliformis mosseae]
MKCVKCNHDKLSKEFPSTTITDRCNHIPAYCLRCLIANLNLKEKPVKCPECNEKLNQEEIKFLTLAWDKAPFKIDVESIGNVRTPQTLTADGASNATGDIYIVLLNGQKSNIPFNQVKTVTALRKEIRQKLRVDEGKQKLIYNGVELQDRKTGPTPSTLQDYNIGPGSHIQLIVVLYNITRAESIKNLTFDLFWGYPANGNQDYLDGTCLLYMGDTFYRKYDYASVFYPSFPHMKHSGDLMDNANKRGHQQITANLDQLPAEVTQLYFILSSFKSPTIGHFQTPSFNLVDQTQPDKPLCTYQLDQAANSQAVIMCCVTRVGQGMWQVIQIGKLSNGNAENYDPIEYSIIQCGLFG